MRWLIAFAILAGCRFGFDDVTGGLGAGGDCSVDGTGDGPAAACGVKLGAGRQHLTAVMPDHTVRVWGLGAYGQIGDGFMMDRSTPTAIAMPADVVHSAGGRYETCVALSTGQARCWGEGTSGQLGNGMSVTSPTPVTVSNLTNVVEVAPAAIHVCVRVSTGEVYCWGDGSSGRLGTGGTGSSNVPVQTMGISTAMSITSGGSTTCVILADGSPRCWGYNQQGGVGVNSMTDVLSPQQPIGLATVRSIQPRDMATCAVRGDGAVYCWGDNTFGQIGIGVTGGVKLVPTPVVDVAAQPLTGGDEVGQGVDFGCARLGTEVWCWGNNTNGQLGDGATNSGHPYAAPVPGLPAIVQLGIAAYGACALAMDGGVWCWGMGVDGELGNGTTPATQPTPIRAFTGCP